MDFAQLKNTLKTQIAPVYLLYGTDIFLLYKSVELITNAVGGGEIVRYDTEIKPDVVVSACQTPSFFSSKRIIVYKIYTKYDTDKKNYKLDDKFDAKIINEYIKKYNAETTLIIMCVADKNILGVAGATEINCNPMPTEKILGLIANQIAPKRITQNGARFLCEATGNNYSVINNELNKIVNYYTDIDLLDTDNIAEFVQKTVDYQIYELGTAILSHKLTEAQKILAYLEAIVADKYIILGGLISQFRRAYYSVATKCEGALVAKVIGGSPYAITYSRRDFGACANEVVARYKQALELEHKVKSGQTSIDNAVFNLLLPC
ncbi:MAG: DNA polymerase III subunit delta [Christensenellaceae bacterium]|jgi:DNA polymerase-3 subunit delta|nr:DNA polymerase III subunit delta [Christensenellaceae bacterium]